MILLPWPAPKTDLDRFKELYDSIGVKYVAGDIGDLSKCYTAKDNEYYHMLVGDLCCAIGNSDKAFEIEQENEDKIEGYGCFHTRILFDKDGKFIKQGFWE